MKKHNRMTKGAFIIIIQLIAIVILCQTSFAVPLTVVEERDSDTFYRGAYDTLLLQATPDPYLPQTLSGTVEVWSDISRTRLSDGGWNPYGALVGFGNFAQFDVDSDSFFIDDDHAFLRNHDSGVVRSFGTDVGSLRGADMLTNELGVGAFDPNGPDRLKLFNINNVSPIVNEITGTNIASSEEYTIVRSNPENYLEVYTGIINNPGDLFNSNTIIRKYTLNNTLTGIVGAAVDIATIPWVSFIDAGWRKVNGEWRLLVGPTVNEGATVNGLYELNVVTGLLTQLLTSLNLIVFKGVEPGNENPYLSPTNTTFNNDWLLATILDENLDENGDPLPDGNKIRDYSPSDGFALENNFNFQPAKIAGAAFTDFDSGKPVGAQVVPEIPAGLFGSFVVFMSGVLLIFRRLFAPSN